MRRNLLKKCETTKLFWGEYFYKLGVVNVLTPIFREKNLSYARQVLDRLQHDYENGSKLEMALGIRAKPVPEEDFLEAKKLYKFFSRREDYRLRVENIHLGIYSNDYNWLNDIVKSLRPKSCESFYKPDSKYKDSLQSDTILVEEDNGYQYRVTLGQRKGSPEFVKWADANPKLIKIGSVTREEMLHEGYVNGMYFYARDEKTLQLCNLMLDCIRRIDKIVTKQSLDK